MEVIDELWRAHGGRLQRLAARELPGDAAAVRAACYHALLRAGRHIARGDDVPTGIEQWRWLRRLLADACREVRAGTIDHTAVPAGPLPGALPAWLRAQLAARAATDADIDEIDDIDGRADLDPISRALRRAWRGLRGEAPGDLAGVALLPILPRLVRRALDAVGAGRARLRRFDGPPSHLLAEHGTRLGHAAGVVGLSEAVAVLSAAVLTVAVGSGPAPLGASSEFGRPPSSVPMMWSRPVAASFPFGLPAAGLPGRQGEDETAGGGGHGAPDSAVTTHIRSNHEELVRRPIQEQPHEGWRRRAIAPPDVSVDLDGDGDADVELRGPSVFIDCPYDPEERGPVTSILCPILDEYDP